VHVQKGVGRGERQQKLINPMNKRFTLHKIAAATFAGLIIPAGFIGCVAMADTECISAKILTANNSCVGTYYAYAKMTNSAGSIWIKPPTNIVVSSGTLTDISGFPAPYAIWLFKRPPLSHGGAAHGNSCGALSAAGRCATSESNGPSGRPRAFPRRCRMRLSPANRRPN